MEIRKEMINGWLKKEYNITELSECYCVSRKTVYKWIERYREKGVVGLEELSREPFNHPNAIPIETVETILAMKREKMRWGPKKILARLKADHPARKWPADSTGNNILKRYGLVQTRKHRHHTPPYTAPFSACNQSNAVWSADYKGHFRMGNRAACYPLTISDNYSRYLIGCWGLSRPNFEQTRACFESAFQRYGLPAAIRTDNGSPFASRGLGGLSRLAIWFIRLGIIPERIEPGCPEQNGRHERMHRTLKEATANPPEMDLETQQQAFDAFIEEFNYERPHEALLQKPPALAYCRSLRLYPINLPEVEYDADTTTRYIAPNGYMKWKKSLIFVSEALASNHVALKQIADHLWRVRFSSCPLGILDEKKGKIVRQ